AFIFFYSSSFFILLFLLFFFITFLFFFFFFFLQILLSPRSTLFPYTTLFRSQSHFVYTRNHSASEIHSSELIYFHDDTFHCYLRSEEHTSELQSRFDLVCRLLLEKKK